MHHTSTASYIIHQCITVVINTLQGNITRDTSFCDAIANNYNEVVLQIFIKTIAKPHVKKLSATIELEQ